MKLEDDGLNIMHNHNISNNRPLIRNKPSNRNGWKFEEAQEMMSTIDHECQPMSATGWKPTGNHGLWSGPRLAHEVHWSPGAGKGASAGQTMLRLVLGRAWNWVAHKEQAELNFFSLSLAQSKQRHIGCVLILGKIIFGLLILNNLDLELKILSTQNCQKKTLNDSTS